MRHARHRGWRLVLLAPLCVAPLVAVGYGAARAAQSQPEMNASARAEWKKQDARLNWSYNRLLEALDAKDRPKLRTAQRAWLAFRDAESEFRSLREEGGSMQAMLRWNAMRDLTSERTAALNAVYKSFTPD